MPVRTAPGHTAGFWQAAAAQTAVAPSLRQRRQQQQQQLTAPRRRVTRMMPIGVPRVPYRTPKEGRWQWVDIWNCLYRERIIFLSKPVDDELGNQVGTGRLVRAPRLVASSGQPGGRLWLWPQGAWCRMRSMLQYGRSRASARGWRRSFCTKM